MASNAELATVFSQMGDMLELLGADRFRVNAHRRAGRAIGDMTTDICSMADDRKAITEIDGIGAKTADKILEYAESGAIAEHAELREQVPAGLLEILELPGLGPKKVKAMWDDLGVETIDDLRRTIDDGSLAGLKGMGAKTVANISDAIAFAARQQGRTRLGVAAPIAELLVDRLRAIAGVERIAYAGSLRRGRDTIGDIDLLAVASDEAAVHQALLETEGVERVLAQGETKTSVLLGDGKRVLQVDLRTVPEASFGAALMYFTGSKEHNVRVRERAQKRGLTLNEYGLFPADDATEPPQRRGVAPVAGKTEQEVFAALDLAFVPPELREDRGEVADGWAPPTLVETADIVSELHAHTQASDGKLSLHELVDAARARGFHTIAVTDHSRSSVIANGLDDDRLRTHMRQIRAHNQTCSDITVLAGSEVDILKNGDLDYDDELLEELDIVVASPHVALRMGKREATDRILRAIEHPLVHIIGHPTGRLIGKRQGLDLDLDEIIAAAVEHDTALEINANSMRLDLRDTHVRAAVRAGANIAIDCDVHRIAHFDELRFGVLTGRRGGLTRDRCVNTWSREALLAWLGAKRPGRTVGE